MLPVKTNENELTEVTFTPGEKNMFTFEQETGLENIHPN